MKLWEDERVRGWTCQRMKLSEDELVIGWICQGLNLSWDEIVRGWNCHRDESVKDVIAYDEYVQDIFVQDEKMSCWKSQDENYRVEWPRTHIHTPPRKLVPFIIKQLRSKPMWRTYCCKSSNVVVTFLTVLSTHIYFQNMWFITEKCEIYVPGVPKKVGFFFSNANIFIVRSAIKMVSTAF